MKFWKTFDETGFLPVVYINNLEVAIPLAKALYEGGIRHIEVEITADNGFEAIGTIANEFADIIVGAGSVVNKTQVKQAIDMGAQFISTPGISKKLIKKCKDFDIPILPGAVSPTEIMLGLEHGIKLFKFYPAGSFGGIKTIKTLSKAFPQINFIATGGVDLSNIRDYLSCNKIKAVDGSWICPSKLVNDENWEEITQIAKEAVSLYKQIRN